MKIVKLENGNIELRNNSGEVLKGLPPAAVLEISQEGAAVRANYGKNNIHDIYASEVTETQILPAAAVPFSGGVNDLLSLLNSSFFFEVTSGGGGEAGSDYIDTYFYTVNVTNADTYPFLIHSEAVPLSNSISFEVDCIANREDSGYIGFRKTIARYAGNNSGVLTLGTQQQTLASGNYAINNISIVDNGTNLELQLNAAGGSMTYNFWIKIRKVLK
jgi:hypothetical protein